MRRLLRKQGFFFEGISTGKLGFDGQTASNVNTYDRQNPRASVVAHSSDSNGDYSQNIYLTKSFGDLPVPAGTFPWSQ